MTDRALLRQLVRRGIGRSLAQDRADHLGDDLACTVHQHGVTDADVLASDVVLVVQRGLGNRHTADLDRLQHGEGIQAAGASDVDLDGPQHRGGLDGRELEGDGPARLAADRAELGLHVEVVDFDHQSIDLIVQ